VSARRFSCVGVVGYDGEDEESGGAVDVGVGVGEVVAERGLVVGGGGHPSSICCPQKPWVRQKAAIASGPRNSKGSGHGDFGVVGEQRDGCVGVTVLERVDEPGDDVGWGFWGNGGEGYVVDDRSL
jgi:hypothetical protein